MPQFEGSGREQEHSMYVTVAASQTTAQISNISDLTKGYDYLHRIVIVPASSTPQGVTLIDGSTNVFVIAANANVPGAYSVELGITATSTKGFNVTTGSSVSCVCIGRFNR